MRLYTLSDDTERARTNAVVAPLDTSEPPFGLVLPGNILAPEQPPLPPDIPGDTLIAWSGTLAPEGLFARDPRTWMPAGLDALRRALGALRPKLKGAHARLLLRPHARHVLADPQRCLTTLRKWRAADAPFGLVLEPAAMLEAGMLAAVEDHLRRAFEALGPLADAILLDNASPSVATPEGDADDPGAAPPLDLVPLHRGAIDPALLVALAREFVPETTPIILRAPEIEAQRALLDV